MPFQKIGITSIGREDVIIFAAKGVNQMKGFSFIELVTVVALIGLVSSTAAPVASSLFQRHREMVLREHLLTLRKALSGFGRNQYDDDADNEIDEDSRGDANFDGYAGIMKIDDDGDLFVDEDWARRIPFTSQSKINHSFDWRVRRDDDEDGVCDEEAYPSDLNDLCIKMPLLHKTIPIDPTLHAANWKTRIIKYDVPDGNNLANNDLDWFVDSNSNGRFDSNEPVVLSTDATYSASYDYVTTGTPPSEGTSLVPLSDEDPRNRLDDDLDGKIDEDAPDMLDLSSFNSAKGLNQTSYSEW